MLKELALQSVVRKKKDELPKNAIPGGNQTHVSENVVKHASDAPPALSFLQKKVFLINHNKKVSNKLP